MKAGGAWLVAQSPCAQRPGLSRAASSPVRLLASAARLIANVHYGHAAVVAKERSATLTAARARHPERFTTTTDPRILALPGPAWINQPKDITEQSAA